MRVLTTDPPPSELEQVLARRRQSGADRFDEVWDGVLHMNPAPRRRHAVLNAAVIGVLGPLAQATGLECADNFNLGEPDSYRIPDSGLLRPGPDALFLPTAALVVEILSPGDESWQKLPFYAALEVDEVVIVDPVERAIHWLALAGGEYGPIERSGLIALGAAELGQRLDWPDLD